MRTLHADLTAAQKAKSRTPYLQVVIKDRFAGLRRLRFQQWYAGSEEDFGHGALAWTDAGTRYLLRARFATGFIVFNSRILDPDVDSTYSSWSGSWTFSFNPRMHLIGMAKAGSTLWVFVVNNATPTEVYGKTSTDNGATWSSSTLQITHSETVTHIAAAGKSNGDVCVVVNDGSNVAAYSRLSGVWQSKVVSSGWALTLTGLAVNHSGDWNVIATGAGTDSVERVLRVIFGDGFFQADGTWSTSLDIVRAEPEANIDYHAPFLAHPDVNRITFRQNHTAAVTYDRLYQSRQPATAGFNADLWREPVPFDLTAPYGAALSSDGTYVFLTTARYVYSAPMTEDELDISADVLDADLHDTPLSPHLSHITLNNADGAYTTPGSGSVVAITKGAEVLVSPGYSTASGDRSSEGPSYHIIGWEHSYEKGRATIKLILGSVWTHLARHRFPRALTFAETDKTIFNQLQYIITRVGSWEVSTVSASAESGNLSPPLAVPPGTSALTAVRRIMERLPDALIVRSEFIFMNEPLAADAADAGYKRPLADGDQEIHAALYRDVIKDANHIQVFADDDASIVADDPDFAETDLLYSAPRQRHDPFLDTGAEATDRAAAEQRNQEILTTRGDRIVAPVHCGLETNDVIAVSDDRHGLTDAKRRVLALQLRYDRHRSPRYDHIITLGAP